MNQNKIVRVAEIEGGCHANQKISDARKELEQSMLDDFGLENGVDIFVSDDARYQGHDAPSMAKLEEKQGEYYVFYLFEVGLTQRAVDILLAEGFIE